MQNGQSIAKANNIMTIAPTKMETRIMVGDKNVPTVFVATAMRANPARIAAKKINANWCIITFPQYIK